VFVNRSPRGYFADELARALHVEVQDALHQLTQQRRVTREMAYTQPLTAPSSEGSY
jgi:plasmid maintenance system antidote protein VapI